MRHYSHNFSENRIQNLFLTRNGVHTIQSSDASIKRGVSNHINGRRAGFIAVRTARRNELVGASVSQKREYYCLSKNKQ